MRTVAIDVETIVAPLLGQAAWRVRLGVGSFITFDFGQKLNKDGHIHGAWHLWIYDCVWKLSKGKRELINSDDDRKMIEPVVRRLETIPLKKLQHNSSARQSTFLFEDFQLTCTPPSDEDDGEYWMLFMPDGNVLSVGPGSSVEIERADGSSSNV